MLAPGGVRPREGGQNPLLDWIGPGRRCTCHAGDRRAGRGRPWNTGMRRRIALGAMALTGLGACTPADTPAPVASRAVLRLAIDLWAGYFPALLADELGLFRDAGLEVRISLPGNTDRMLAEFAAGRHDLVAAALADMVNLLRGGQSVQVVLQSDESAGGDRLLQARRALPQGRRLVVGTNLGGFGELFVHAYLAREQIAPGRVSWVNIDAADAPQALRQGNVDLVHTWDPYAAAAVAEGAVEVFSSRDTPGLIPDVVVTLRSTAEQRRAELRAFAGAWFRAQDWWQAHRPEGDQRLARRLGQSAEWVATAAAGVHLSSLAENHRLLGRPGQPGALAATLGRYNEFFAARGTLTHPIDAAQVLRADLLP